MDTSLQIEWLYVSFIDVFPWWATHQMVSIILHTNKIKYYRALSKYLSSIDCTIATEVSLKIHQKVSKILHPDKLLNTEKINQKLQNTIKKCDFETSDLVGNVLGSYRERDGLQKRYLGSHNSLILKLKSVVMLIRCLFDKDLWRLYEVAEESDKRSLWIHLGE